MFDEGVPPGCMQNAYLRLARRRNIDPAPDLPVDRKFCGPR
jgi:hypothetical protein